VFTSQVLNKSKRNIEALALFGWISISSGQGRNERKSAQFFDASIKLCDKLKDVSVRVHTTAAVVFDDSPFCSQALHGRAKFNERRKRYDKALEDLITIIASYPYADAPSDRAILGSYSPGDSLTQQLHSGAD
jgi:hypothetical protein